jgi:DNA-binding transcriptional ArsR family regulator
MARDDIPELVPEQLKALTHPLRVAMLRALRADGPATASALGRRLGESSGATSYHLRQLEKHGFVEEVPDSGDGRDRWWRPAFRGHRVETEKWLDDPEAASVVALYETQVVRVAAENAATFVAEQGSGEWSREWVAASDLSDFRLHLTPAQLTRLRGRLHALVNSFGRYDSAGSEQVIVQVQAFPRRPAPFGETP